MTTGEQINLLPQVNPDELVLRVMAEHRPIATVCLFSGGHDSTVLAHRCREYYDTLAFIDTGTAVPGVEEFVVNFASWIGKPLRILRSGTAYRDLVLGKLGGFPGPAQHNRAYNQLKERQLRVLRRELKYGYAMHSRVLFLTGIRRAESARRKGRQEITRDGSIVFANPLIDWTKRQMTFYRYEHHLPESEVAGLLHRSGECNCGSFAASGEREELKALWPEWFEENIASLEREAEAAGLKNCRWGERPEVTAESFYTGETLFDDQPLCADCPVRAT